jgi:hypothetical protein
MWIVIGIIFWVIGFKGVGFVEQQGFILGRVFLRPPTIIYLMCGLPEAPNIPSGVMSGAAIVSQLHGIVDLFLNSRSSLISLKNVIASRPEPVAGWRGNPPLNGQILSKNIHRLSGDCSPAYTAGAGRREEHAPRTSSRCLSGMT